MGKWSFQPFHSCTNQSLSLYLLNIHLIQTRYLFPTLNRFLFLAFYPSYSSGQVGCSAINHDVLNNLESIGERHCGTPLSCTWFVGGIYHTNSPEVISIFTRQSVLHTSHLENSWLLPIIHKWRLTFRLGRGHIHYVKKYHRLMRQWLFFLFLFCLCIWNSIQGLMQTRGPWLTWCILYVNMVLMYFKMQTRP